MNHVLNNNAKIKYAGVDYLKVVAILLVVLSHSVPFYGSMVSSAYVDLNLATSSPSYLFLILFRHLGQIGNCIFMIVTSYFLCDRNNVKSEKLIRLIVDSFVFSITVLLLFFVVGVHLSTKEIVRQFFPITFDSLWFIGVYIIVYCIHPRLNDIIANSSKQRLFRISMTMFILYSIVPFVLGGSKFYYNNLVGFITIYFIVAYWKKYLNHLTNKYSFNLCMFIINSIVFLVFLLTLNFLGLHVTQFNDKMLRMNNFVNPFILNLSLGLFFLFKNAKVKESLISKCNVLTLYVYMIHENQLIRDYIKPLYFEKISFNPVPSCIILFMLSLVISFLISVIYYRFISPFISKIVVFINRVFKLVYFRIEDKFLEL